MPKNKVYKLKELEYYLIHKKDIVYTECDVNGNPIIKRRRWDNTNKYNEQSYIVSDSSRLTEVCNAQKSKQLEIFN